MGLNDSFESTRCHTLMLKPIPTIEDAFNLVTQDERQKNIKPLTKTEGVVFQTSGSPVPVNSDMNVYNRFQENYASAMQGGYRPR